MRTKNYLCAGATVALGLAVGGCVSDGIKTESGDQMEKLTVCEVFGDPHLLKGDVIYLKRRGASGKVDMQVVRNEGMPNEMHPWKSRGGTDDTIVVNPEITGKDHDNAAFKKFSPEAVGVARVNPHSGDPAEDHTFSMRRNTRVNSPNACNTLPGDEDMMIFVPPHEEGGRHGGHAVAN